MFKIKGILTTGFCLAMLLTNGVARAQESQDTLFISLDTAIEIALEESNTIKIADLTIKKTGYAKKGSYAALYPNISVHAEETGHGDGVPGAGNGNRSR